MPKKEDIEQKVEDKSKGKEPIPVVAIGASAGGLEALEVFFDNLPTDLGVAFVIIQHKAPTGKSLLIELLQRHSQMEVLDAEHGEELKPNCIYLNPPDKQMGIIDGLIFLEDTESGGGRVKLPIDYFFRSLAQDRREKAICIVLSGAGSDGALGLKAIKEMGGMAMVQDPDEAKYDGMPRSAIMTGQVDYVLPVKKMPQELMSYIKHPYLQKVRKEAEEKQLSDSTQRILMLVRSTTGRDFTHYKPKTIRRRIERRMALHKLASIKDYYRYLQENQREVQHLSKEFLIGVTSFFRDPAAFDALAEKVVPDILKHKKEGDPIRIWVPGCSTGEEAISLAMLFIEGMENLGKQFPMQIFATDLDSEAIERARHAEYVESISADVSEERLKRFFTRVDGKYKVRSEIRESIVFAVQDLTSDPPFSKLDLVSCRNLLIYVDMELQQKIIPLLHFTLNPKGYLFLGSSESIGKFTDFFSQVDVKWKIYQAKKDSAEPIAREWPKNQEFPHFRPGDVQKERQTNLYNHEIFDRLILNEYAPAGVLVNEKHEAVYFRGPVERFFELPKGEASFNILKISRVGLSHKLPSALQKALAEKKTVVIPGVQVKDSEGLRTADVTIRPLQESGTATQLLAIVFEEKSTQPTTHRKRKKGSAGSEIDPRILELQQEIQLTRENLQTTIEELEAANEELKSSNEELQSMNEEVQSTNEELVTAKEELQSTNEELVTVNSELQSKVEQLTEANNDINNLLASTEIGTIFLDEHLGIRRFTPTMRKFFNLISTDIGRPLKHITSKITCPTLFEDAQTVSETLQAKEREVRTEDGKWFLMRILPYRRRDNMIDGLVMTFIDITDRKQAERETWQAKAYVETIADAVRQPLMTLDTRMRVVMANERFYSSFGYRPEEVVGKSLFEIEGGRWNIPGLRDKLETIVSQKGSLKDLEIEHEFSPLGSRRLIFNLCHVQLDSEPSGLVLLSIEDVTECKK